MFYVFGNNLSGVLDVIWMNVESCCLGYENQENLKRVFLVCNYLPSVVIHTHIYIWENIVLDLLNLKCRKTKESINLLFLLETLH